jgi:hypothetical protein
MNQVMPVMEEVFKQVDEGVAVNAAKPLAALLDAVRRVHGEWYGCNCSAHCHHLADYMDVRERFINLLITQPERIVEIL